MKSLEMLIENPVAAAMGWTLLHSLWEGAVVVAVLVATLLVLRTARARYLAACVALFALLVLFTLTLLRLAPESAQRFSVGERIFPGWNLVADDASSGYRSPNLSAAVPWLALLWIARSPGDVWALLGQLHLRAAISPARCLLCTRSVAERTH